MEANVLVVQKFPLVFLNQSVVIYLSVFHRFLSVRLINRRVSFPCFYILKVISLFPPSLRPKMSVSRIGRSCGTLGGMGREDVRSLLWNVEVRQSRS